MKMRALAVIAFLMVIGAPATAQAGTHAISPQMLIVNSISPDASDENEGTEQRPLKTIGRAAALAGPGCTVVIHTGTYREAVVIEQSGTADSPIRFEAAPGAHVVVTGAQLLTEWRKEPSDAGEQVFSTVWPHRFITWNPTYTHPEDDYHLLIGRAEQVFVDGYPLRQVLSRDKVTRGTFYVDLENQRLYVQADSNADLTNRRHRVEASVHGTVWDVRGEYVHTCGITFQYAANPAQRGMVCLRGRGDQLEDCVIQWSNANGLSLTAPDQVVRRCVFQYNGQEGFTAAGAHSLLIADCIVRQNNIKNFNRGWEAGALKICLSRGVVLEHSQFVENRGHGIWFDIGNEDCTVRHNLIANNDDAGVFYEISYGLHLHDNVIVGNGFRDTAGAWGANGGVSLSSSPGCLVERNLIIGNKEGIQFREQNRTTRRIGQKRGEPETPIWNHDEIIRNNLIAHSRDAHVWGWFDIDDKRYLPAALQGIFKTTTAEPFNMVSWVAFEGPVRATTPEGASLEDLKIRFENNLYYGTPARGLWVWGVPWRKARVYRSLEEAAAELKILSDCYLDDLPFPNTHAHDFRLPKNHKALAAGCYPQGKIPGVILGTIADR